MTDERPRKRSVTLAGHRTSVSLETPFWDAFSAIARARGLSVNALATRIDAQRTPGVTLAGAIRLFVLADLSARLPPTEPPGDTPAPTPGQTA